MEPTFSLFGWLVADGWCWFVLREEYCWLVAGGCFVAREKYCWLVADKPSEQGVYFSDKCEKIQMKARRIPAEMAASHSLIKLKTRRKGKWILVDGSAKQARTQPLGRAGPAASGRKGPGRVAQPRPPPHRYHGGSV
jgi:hypothetical protein